MAPRRTLFTPIRLAGCVAGLLGAAGCGARSTHSSSGAPPTLEKLVLARGADLRFEAISDDGERIAYSSARSLGGRDIWVVASSGGEPAPVGFVADLDSARFGRTTLLVFRGDGVADGQGGSGGPCSGKSCGPAPATWSPELLGWRPGDAALTSLATDVDPGSVRFSHDGRWISLEANDTLLGGARPDILLVSTSELSVRRLGAFNLARARFTDPSDWLVFGGVGTVEPAADIAAALPDAHDCVDHYVARLSLDEDLVLPVTCFAASLRSRWEISRDGDWLVHGLQSGGAYGLARTPLAGGSPEILGPALRNADSGKSFDIARGKREEVAFLGSEAGLAVVPLSGGAPETLVPADVTGIAEHYGSTIAYHSLSGMLEAIPADGGRSVSLGLSSEVLDEAGDALLALDEEGVLHWFHTNSGEVNVMGASVRDARMVMNERVLASAGPAEPPWTLLLFDASGSSRTLAEISGPFGIDPAELRFFVTTVQAEEESELVLTSFISD